jgi:hypothetical protein
LLDCHFAVQRVFVVFDFSLQMRFWRSATEAMFEGAAASMAAATEFQSHFLEQAAPAKEPEPEPFDALNPLSWWQLTLSAVSPPQPKPKPAAAEITALTFFNPLSWMGGQSAPKLPMTPPGPDQWMKFYSDLWLRQPFAWANANPWTLWQPQLTMMMMTAGMPYSVASPAARASTASMDAADAARQQMERAFAAYRSDGGHASAQISQWPLNVMAGLASAALASQQQFTTLLH